MSVNNRSFVADLPDFLTWQCGTELIRSACSIYVHWTYNQLRAWSDAAKSDLFNNALKLPRPNQQRLLIAPQSFALLSSSATPGEEQINTFRQFIHTENYLCDQRVEYPADSWTALCDYYLPSEKPAELPTREFSSWGGNQMFKAPTIGHIILDAYSPGATVDCPPYFGEVMSHNGEEVDLIKARIEESFDLIDSISRTARLTVGSSTQVISIAKSPADLRKTASVSKRSRIGRMGLFNLHSEASNVYKISNAIVHESIHSLIYKLELHEDLYADQNASHEVMTVSPWTERPLQVHSFVHACFVWYGLLNFWNLTPDAQPAISRLRDRAYRGFESGSPLLSISPEAREVIAPNVRLVIEEMHERVMKTN